MIKFVSAVIAATSLIAAAGCATDTGSAQELAAAQESDALASCPNAQGTNAAIAAFAVAYATEAHHWQILNDFEEFRGTYYQLQLRAKSTGACANNACPMTSEILRYQDATHDNTIVYDGQLLSAYNFASRLTTGYDNMQAYKTSNRYTFPSHTLNFVSMANGTVCSWDFTYNATVASGTLDGLVNALRFTDGNGQNPYLFTYDSAGNPHLRVSGSQIIVDPTGGTSGDPSTSSSGDLTKAGCQAISQDKINFKDPSGAVNADGTNKMVVGNGYPCTCATKNIPAGFMRISDSTKPNTYLCGPT